MALKPREYHPKRNVYLALLRAIRDFRRAEQMATDAAQADGDEPPPEIPAHVLALTDVELARVFEIPFGQLLGDLDRLERGPK